MPPLLVLMIAPPLLPALLAPSLLMIVPPELPTSVPPFGLIRVEPPLLMSPAVPAGASPPACGPPTGLNVLPPAKAGPLGAAAFRDAIVALSAWMAALAVLIRAWASWIFCAASFLALFN